MTTAPTAPPVGRTKDQWRRLVHRAVAALNPCPDAKTSASGICPSCLAEALYETEQAS